MGHVLQISLGEDHLGTGIPVYYALVDYVVEAEAKEDHLQIRKVFSSKKLLDEGFANVEVLFLDEDPTTAILMEEFRDQKMERDFTHPPVPGHSIVLYSLAAILIGVSILTAIIAIQRLDDGTVTYGWISLAVGLFFMYPCALLLYRSFTYLYSLASMSDRPGVILHGKILAKGCHGVNPCEIYNHGDVKSLTKDVIELPTFNRVANDNERKKTDRMPLFPNAGCGFRNFNVHLPTRQRGRTNSSVSTMSASASQHSSDTASNIDCAGRIIVRNDTSILEKYEMHVSMSDKN